MDKSTLVKLQEQDIQALAQKHAQEQRKLKDQQSQEEAELRARHAPGIQRLEGLLAAARLPLEIKSRELPLAQARQSFSSALSSLQKSHEAQKSTLLASQRTELARLKEYHDVEPYVIDLLEQAVEAKHLLPTVKRDNAYVLRRYEKNTLFGTKTVEERAFQQRGQLPVPTTLKRDVVARSWQLGGRVPGQCVLLFSVALAGNQFEVSALSDASWSRGGDTPYSIDSIGLMDGPRVKTKSVDRASLENAIVEVMAGVRETGPCDLTQCACDCYSCGDACD